MLQLVGRVHGTLSLHFACRMQGYDKAVLHDDIIAASEERAIGWVYNQCIAKNQGRSLGWHPGFGYKLRQPVIEQIVSK